MGVSFLFFEPQIIIIIYIYMRPMTIILNLNKSFPLSLKSNHRLFTASSSP